MPQFSENSEPSLKDNLSGEDGPAPDQARTPVVGIGASAGGLEAVMQLLRPLPGDTGMAFVFVQHLDPTHESKLTEILTKVTSIAVHEIRDGMPVDPNTFYVIPPNTSLKIAKGVLTIEPRTDAPAPHFLD